MKFYRVTWTHSHHGTGYIWARSMRDATREAKKWREDFAEPDVPPENRPDASTSVELIEIEPTKAGIFRVLQRYASHNDNG